MKLREIIFCTAFVLSVKGTFAQQSGNQVIGQHYYNNQSGGPQAVDKLYLSDTSFIIQANVLINTIADSYVAIF